jgi:hypothetical protein
MLALTIWQPWASLIMIQAKPFEFRRWAAPKRLVGQRIVIHAGVKPVKRSEVAELILRLQDDPKGTGLIPDLALPLLERVHLNPGALPLGTALGTAVLGQPREASRLFAGVIDSDRVDHHVWGWPLTDHQPFEPPIPARGAQGFWAWNEAAHG